MDQPTVVSIDRWSFYTSIFKTGFTVKTCQDKIVNVRGSKWRVIDFYAIIIIFLWKVFFL